MTLMQADFEAQLQAAIDDYEIQERYKAQDPLVVHQLRSMASFLTAFGPEIDIASIEPFTKTRDRSIIADATNKGILPIGTPCQHYMEIINRSLNPVSLSQGRMVEDHSGGRVWRLLQSITVKAGETAEVIAEQSEYREIKYVVPVTEGFHKYRLELLEDLSLANISIKQGNNNFAIKPRWMNVEPSEYAVTVTTDNLRRIFVEFGDSERAGRTVQANETITFGILETYGEVDANRLKDAALLDVLTNDEQRVSVRFKVGGLVRQGVDPLSVSELRLLSSYPSLYDDDAVFLGNFDYAVRKKFMKRAQFISVWNETLQEQHFAITYRDINHLNLVVVAKNPDEQTTLEQDICSYIGYCDNLYKDKVNVHDVVEKPLPITITGTLASVHNTDMVKTQIIELIVQRYGRESLSSSRWLVNGFNSQEMAKLINDNIVAFQDRMSDFSIKLSNEINKPNEWVYVTKDSITVNMERTADISGATWTL